MLESRFQFLHIPVETRKDTHDQVQDNTISKFFNNHIGIWHCSNQGASWAK